MARALIVLIVLLSSTGCAATRWTLYRLAPDNPRPKTATLELGGLSAPVQVHFDAQGVPHVDAQSEDDLLRAMGYLHARERFFQMDLLRRVAQGRVSALLGEQAFLSGTTVDYDRAMAGWGFGRLGAQDAVEVDPETRARMEAYTGGVNAAIARHVPIEHRLLGLTPEPWRIEDTFALGRLQAWTVSHNWEQECSRLLLAIHGGADRASRIYPDEAWAGPSSLRADASGQALPPGMVPEARALFPDRGPPGPSGEGLALRGIEADLASRGGASNGWVVGGARSASGKPLLANDPHLSYLVPALFFQVQLRAPGLDVIGMSIPGTPYVLAGHNRALAWGMTSAVADVIDLVLERIEGDTVMGPEGAYPLIRDEVEIVVRGGETRRFVLRRTQNGPLLNDLYPGLLPEDGPLVAIRWHSGSAGESVAALRDTNRARTLEELRAAFARFNTPLNVWTAADVEGRVALFVNGTLPVRGAHRGTFPVPGWLAEYAWQGQVAPEAMPAELGGEDDLFVHANNLLRDPTESSVQVHVDTATSYRYERIEALLQATPRHDVSTFSAIQSDLHLPRAVRILPRLLEDLEALAEKSPRAREALALLRGWDHVATADSAAAALFFATYREAAIGALEDELPARPFQYVLSQRYMTNAMDTWFDDPGHPVWDDRRTPEVEGRAAMVQAAFARALSGLESAQGAGMASWRWGVLHSQHMTHPFGSKSALAPVVNFPVEEVGGGIDSVWKSHFDMGHSERPFRPTAGPVSRMVVDLADLDHGWWILNGGASGWPGTAHYGDQHALWLEGAMVPMTSDWDEVAAAAVGVLTLR